MSFSIITVALNSSNTLSDTILSVADQKNVEVEHIVKDGVSIDKTTDLISKSRNKLKFLSTPDIGIYDAMNQGFTLASNDYIGFLNSDDFYCNGNVLQKVEEVFKREKCDIVYGDIDIITSAGKVKRHWKSGTLNNGKLRGKQLPHPAFFVRRDVLNLLSVPFDPTYAISADFKQQLILLDQINSTAVYLPITITKMRAGGASNISLKSIFLGWQESLRAHREVKQKSGLMFIIQKVLRKILQIKI